jgi:hypothetical protein
MKVKVFCLIEYGRFDPVSGLAIHILALMFLSWRQVFKFSTKT